MQNLSSRMLPKLVPEIMIACSLFPENMESIIASLLENTSVKVSSQQKIAFLSIFGAGVALVFARRTDHSHCMSFYVIDGL